MFTINWFFNTFLYILKYIKDGCVFSDFPQTKQRYRPGWNLICLYIDFIPTLGTVKNNPQAVTTCLMLKKYFRGSKNKGYLVATPHLFVSSVETSSILWYASVPLWTRLAYSEHIVQVSSFYLFQNKS